MYGVGVVEVFVFDEEGLVVVLYFELLLVLFVGEVFVVGW